MILLDGKGTSELIINELAQKVLNEGLHLKLVMVIVGENPASLIYVRNKERACKKANIESVTYRLEENATQKQLLDIINKAKNDPTVNVIMVQMPLPKHIDENTILNAIDPDKDVDGLNMINQGRLFTNVKGLVPATPKGILSLCKYYNISLTGKNCVVVGRSKLVGKPMGMLLLNNNATVTYTHSKTVNLKEITKKADILIVAIGSAHFITADMVKKEAVVIDVGTNRHNGQLTGDVDFDEVSKIASYISPVPKGVGPMTIASLLENVYEAYKIQHGIND